jgi:hypothetical protein
MDFTNDLTDPVGTVVPSPVANENAAAVEVPCRDFQACCVSPSSSSSGRAPLRQLIDPSNPVHCLVGASLPKVALASPTLRLFSPVSWVPSSQEENLARDGAGVQAPHSANNHGFASPKASAAKRNPYSMETPRSIATPFSRKDSGCGFADVIGRSSPVTFRHSTSARFPNWMSTANKTLFPADKPGDGGECVAPPPSLAKYSTLRADATPWTPKISTWSPPTTAVTGAKPSTPTEKLWRMQQPLFPTPPNFLYNSTNPNQAGRLVEKDQQQVLHIHDFPSVHTHYLARTSHLKYNGSKNRGDTVVCSLCLVRGTARLTKILYTCELCDFDVCQSCLAVHGGYDKADGVGLGDEIVLLEQSKDAGSEMRQTPFTKNRRVLATPTNHHLVSPTASVLNPLNMIHAFSQLTTSCGTGSGGDGKRDGPPPDEPRGGSGSIGTNSGRLALNSAEVNRLRNQFGRQVANPLTKSKDINGSNGKGFTVYISISEPHFHETKDLEILMEQTIYFDTTWPTVQKANERAKYIYMVKNAWNPKSLETTSFEEVTNENGMKQYVLLLPTVELWSATVSPDEDFQFLPYIIPRGPRDRMALLLAPAKSPAFMGTPGV